MRSKPITPCQRCGTPFITTAYAIRHGGGKFCSRECYWLAKKGTGKPIAERFWPKVEKTDSCWLWTGVISNNGYGKFGIDGKARLAPRVAWELTNGPIPEGLLVCHHCDNPLCVNPAHLFLGTQFDNMRDCAAKGRNGAVIHPERLMRGTANKSAKLTEDDVREIRRLSAEGMHQREIAARFGVSHNSVGQVQRGKTWKHVE